MRALAPLLILAAIAAPCASRADAITDLIEKMRRENAAAAAARPDVLRESDRAECYTRAIAAGGSVQKQMDVEAACLRAARLRAQGR